MMKKATIAVLSASVTLLALAACGPQESTVRLETKSAAPTASAPSFAPTAKVAKFGQSHLFADGVAIGLGSAKKFKIGQYAAGGSPGGDGVMLTITVTNGTSKPFDVTLTSVKLTYGADGNQADGVFDSQAGIGAGFSGQIQAGRKMTAKYAFAVPAVDAGDLQVEVLTDPMHRGGALFAGAAV